MPKIERKDFELWEQIILSDQVPVAELEEVLEENPEFAEWYNERVIERRGPIAHAALHEAADRQVHRAA